MSQKIILTVQIKAHSGKETQLKEKLRTLVKHSQTEKGCIQYYFYQSKNDPLTFLCYEVWENKAALDAHQESLHFKEFFQSVGDFLAGQPEAACWVDI